MYAPHRHTLVRPKIADARGALQIDDATSRVAAAPSELGRPRGNVTQQPPVLGREVAVVFADGAPGDRRRYRSCPEWSMG
jgi:hypothetical protein